MQGFHHFGSELAFAVQNFAHPAFAAQPRGQVALAWATLGHLVLDVLDGVRLGDGVDLSFVGAHQHAESVQLIKLRRAKRGIKNGFDPGLGLLVVGFGANGLNRSYGGCYRIKVGSSRKNFTFYAV